MDRHGGGRPARGRRRRTRRGTARHEPRGGNVVLVAAADRPARRPRGAACRLGAHADRRLHPRGPGGVGPGAGTTGRSPHAPASRDVRPHRSATDARRGRRVPRGRLVRRVRARRGAAPLVLGLRRALGPTLARRGPLRRFQRSRREPRLRSRLALPRLRRRLVQCGQALRSVPHRTDRRRPAPRCERRDDHRHRLSRARREGPRGARPREAHDGHDRRADRRDRQGTPRHDARVHAVSRPQVRPADAGRLLRPGRDLQEHPHVRRHEHRGDQALARARPRHRCGEGGDEDDRRGDRRPAEGGLLVSLRGDGEAPRGGPCEGRRLPRGLRRLRPRRAAHGGRRDRHAARAASLRPPSLPPPPGLPPGRRGVRSLA